jgi:hypothetical protein
VIGEMGCGLGHVPTVAGGADAPSLTGEGHDKTLAAPRAESACESKAEDAALEIAAEFLLDVARHGPLGAVAPLEPALEVLGDDPVSIAFRKSSSSIFSVMVPHVSGWLPERNPFHGGGG